MFDLSLSDVIKYAESYDGEPFHAVLCDPPYHLTSIVKRFGKKGSVPAKGGAYARVGRGFMGKTWDGGDVAFRPETWHTIGGVMYAGAFGVAFASPRGYHRLACAIEDAGFVIHPMIGWIYSSGLPKATRIDRRAENGDTWVGHRYGAQALKPALEPIVVFQKPYVGRALDNIADTGAGALNIDYSRVGLSEESNGRWPANFLVSHHPECVPIGIEEDGYTINTFDDGEKPFGGGAGHEYSSADASSKIVLWDCHEQCPLSNIDKAEEFGKYFFNAHYLYERLEESDSVAYVSKASVSEREEGIENGDERMNIHPSVKPIALAEYLAKLLLPPDSYQPRRLLVPFCGSGSEMIGAHLAGWEQIFGIDFTKEYIDIARGRLEYWTAKPRQLNLFE